MSVVGAAAGTTLRINVREPGHMQIRQLAGRSHVHCCCSNRGQWAQGTAPAVMGNTRVETRAAVPMPSAICSHQ